MKIKVYSAREVFWIGLLGGIFIGVFAYHADRRATHDATRAGYVVSCFLSVVIALPVTAAVNRLAVWNERRRTRPGGWPDAGPPGADSGARQPNEALQLSSMHGRPGAPLGSVAPRHHHTRTARN